MVGNLVDFNPLPRKEGDTDAVLAAYARLISIHSLVKRETIWAAKTVSTK